MKIIRNNHWLFFIFSIGLLLSCKASLPEESTPTAVKFKSSISLNKQPNSQLRLSPYGQSNSGYAQWEAGDEIGIFMIKNGATTVVPGSIVNSHDNVPYRTNVDGLPDANSWGSEVDFDAVLEEIYFPQDGSSVNFLAYFPYTPHKVEENYNIFNPAPTTGRPFIDGFNKYYLDVSDQSNQSILDFLVSNGENNPLDPFPAIYDKITGASGVDLVFEHQLASLIIQVVPGSGQDGLPISSDAFVGMTATIHGVYSYGEQSFTTNHSDQVVTVGDTPTHSILLHASPSYIDASSGDGTLVVPMPLFQGILIPQTWSGLGVGQNPGGSPGSVRVSFTVAINDASTIANIAGLTFDWVIPFNQFVESKQYIYTVSLGYKGVAEDQTLATINNWMVISGIIDNAY